MTLQGLEIQTQKKHSLCSLESIRRDEDYWGKFPLAATRAAGEESGGFSRGRTIEGLQEELGLASQMGQNVPE